MHNQQKRKITTNGMTHGNIWQYDILTIKAETII